MAIVFEVNYISKVFSSVRSRNKLMRCKMKKNSLFLILLFAIMIAVSACSSQPGNVASNNKNNVDGSNEKAKATIFKSESCGCCDLYASYLDKKGFDIEVVQMEDISSIKEKYHIPAKMQSCHTMAIGDYFVEGHMPEEAISKLLAEKPDIMGIALPGMPSGSPGMPGSKRSPFVVYAVAKDGSISEFMKI